MSESLPAPLGKVRLALFSLLVCLTSYGLVIAGWDFATSALPLWAKVGLPIGFGLLTMVPWREPRPNAMPDDLCSFARSFDCRRIDTWCIRATHETLSRFNRPMDRPAQVLADQSIDFHLCDDEIDEVMMVLLDLAGRLEMRRREDPYTGNFETVRDIVEWLNVQPIDPARRPEMDGPAAISVT